LACRFGKLVRLPLPTHLCADELRARPTDASRSDSTGHVRRGQRFVTYRAHNFCCALMIAVYRNGGDTGAARKPSIAPGKRGEDHWHQVQPLFSEYVVKSRWVILVCIALDQIIGNHRVEALCKNLSGHSKVFDNLVEAGQAKVEVTNDHCLPGVAHHPKRASD
jgi:hypothetical protein